MLIFGKIFEGQMLSTTYMESGEMTIYDYKERIKPALSCCHGLVTHSCNETNPQSRLFRFVSCRESRTVAHFQLDQ